MFFLLNRGDACMAKKCGLPVNIVSGGSTGTYNIDHETGLTELESGTYVFMDTEYFIVGGKDGDRVAGLDGHGAILISASTRTRRWASSISRETITTG